MPEADELVEALGDVFERQRADDEADDDRTFRALVSQRMDAVEQQLRHVVGRQGQILFGSVLLARFAARRAWGPGVKCAPTLRPQALLSMRRLEMRLREAGLGQVVEGEDGYSLSLGTARMVFLSAGPGSNGGGHTAGTGL